MQILPEFKDFFLNPAYMRTIKGGKFNQKLKGGKEILAVSSGGGLECLAGAGGFFSRSARIFRQAGGWLRHRICRQ